MGLGSGGLWIGVTFATLAYRPGQEYLCMSRIYAAYSAGALVGPSLAALGGPAVCRLRSAAGAGRCRVAALPRVRSGVFGSDAAVVRTGRFWVSVMAIMVAVMAAGMLDGVLPLHLSLRLSQADGGLVPARDRRLPRRTSGRRPYLPSTLASPPSA